MVWYGMVPLLPPVSARGFAEGGGVMQRLAGQTDSEISACSEMDGEGCQTKFTMTSATVGATGSRCFGEHGELLHLKSFLI
jgi:hypothetical protein